MKFRISVAVSVLALVLVAFLAGRHYWSMMADGPGEAAIGGPFELVDPTGKTVTDADFRGRIMLVYFGYTYCPDVCPTSLTAMADALDMLGEDAKEFAPIFITVDPERDGKEAMGEYAAAFHPQLVGLTGSLDQVKAAAKAYRVYFAKVREEGDDPEDYLVDHSAYIYVMDRNGKYVTHFPHGTDPGEMARRLLELL